MRISEFIPESGALRARTVLRPPARWTGFLFLLGVALAMAGAGPTGAVNRYIEEFDTTTFKDAANTAADWNTAAGKLQLFSFQPSLLGTYDSPGVASRVAYAGTVAYLADGASGLRIVNASNPSSPVSLGSFDTSGNANDVAIWGTVAYVADGASGLQIINVVNPASPALLGTFNTSGDAKGVAISGTVAYVADGVSGLQIINVSNPASPALLGTFNTTGDARSVAISGRTAYVADDVSGLQVINVTNGASPTLLGVYNTPGLASSVAVSGTRAYVADDLSGLQIINVSNPASPTLLGTFDTPGNALGVEVSGTQAYVADAAAGVHVIDASNPSSPTLLFSADTPGTASGIAGQGARAFVADGASGLQVVQLGLDPREPIVVGSSPPLAGNITIVGNRAYVAKYADGVGIFDITDPVNPVLLGACDTPGDAYAVAISGDFAYVADHTTGLVVIDVSDPANPALVGTCDTPGFPVDVAVSGTSVYVADIYALQVIDVSNPTSPTLIGSLPTESGDESIAVDVSGSVAYVANVVGGLTSIDVSNPRNPNLLGGFPTLGFSYGIAVEGTTAYLSTTQLPGLILAGVMVLNVGNPANPTALGWCATPGTPGGITLSGSTAFVACSTSGLVMIDVSDPRNPDNFWTYPGYAATAAVHGNHVYVTTDSGVDILMVDDPASSSLIGTCDTPGEALDVAVSGTVAYVADNTSGLQIIDISNPSSPASLGAYDTPVQARAVAVSGTVAYVADYETLQIIDVSNPMSPTFLGSYNTPGIAEGVAVSGTVAYVTVGTQGGLQIINVSNPASPALLGSFDTQGSAGAVAVSGTVAYVADGNFGLRIINVSNPASPAGLGVYDTFGWTTDVAVAGTLAYVADREGGLQILNVSNPASPQFVGAYSDGSNWAEAVTPFGSVAYVANSGLGVFNVSNPAKPARLSHEFAEARAIAVSGSVACVACRYDGLRIFQVVEQRFDAARPRGQSLAINHGLPVRRARLTSTEVHDVVWRLSGDGGITWEAATPGGYWVTFEDGSDLRWQASLVPVPPSFQASPPAVSRVEVEWLSSHPVIESIRDIAADQGGRVRLRFGRSGYDEADDRTPVIGYQVYHRVDDVVFASRVRGEGSTPDRDEVTTSQTSSTAMASLETESIRTLHGRAFVLGGEESPASFPPGTWEAVTWIGATQSEAYDVPVATDADSTFGAMEWSVYLVTAHTKDPEFWFASAPDSGYSVDNLAPNVPGDFIAQSQGEAGILLDWTDPVDDDFRYFNVYRSSDPGFPHGPGNRVHSTTGSSWVDPSPGEGSVYYKLTAFDFSGNESDPAEATVTVGVGGAPLPARFALHPAVPNPVRHSARVRYDVPVSGGKVVVGIYDVQGRLRRTLVDRVEAPGERSIVWDGRDERGHELPAGVYVCRLRAPDFTQSRKLLLAR